jgi:hypothetical protein
VPGLEKDGLRRLLGVDPRGREPPLEPLIDDGPGRLPRLPAAFGLALQVRA